jgi:hypothetical protein
MLLHPRLYRPLSEGDTRRRIALIVQEYFHWRKKNFALFFIAFFFQFHYSEKDFIRTFCASQHPERFTGKSR